MELIPRNVTERLVCQLRPEYIVTFKKLWNTHPTWTPFGGRSTTFFGSTAQQFDSPLFGRGSRSSEAYPFGSDFQSFSAPTNLFPHSFAPQHSLSPASSITVAAASANYACPSSNFTNTPATCVSPSTTNYLTPTSSTISSAVKECIICLERPVTCILYRIMDTLANVKFTPQHMDCNV
jgi:hypothetical protein